LSGRRRVGTWRSRQRGWSDEPKARR